MEPGTDMTQPGDATTLGRLTAERMRIDEAEATNLVQGVLRAVEGAVDRETLERLRAQLPADLSGLLARADQPPREAPR